jgi:hypothetical protein
MALLDSGFLADFDSALFDDFSAPFLFHDGTNNSDGFDIFASASPSDPFAEYAAGEATSSDSSLDAAPAAHPEAVSLTEFDDTRLLAPLSPGRDMPATPIGRIRRRSKLFAYETLRDSDEPFDTALFLASPHMVLALIVRLDAPTLVAVSATCRVWRDQYGPLLGPARSPVRRRFGREVLTSAAWSLAYEFPHLMVRTLSPSLVFKAGKARPDPAFVQWIFQGIPSDHGVDTLALLRYYMCGAASNVQHQHAVRLLALEILGNHPAEAATVLDWPLDGAMHDEPPEARTFIDFLVAQTPCDAMFVLLLVNEHRFRLTTFATRAVIAHNTTLGRPGVPVSESTTLPSSLISHYIGVLVQQVQDACTACDAKRVKLMWDSHHADVVVFAANQYHAALLDLVVRADPARFTTRQKVKTIETLLDACTRINGPALAQAAIGLKSLRLFELAFDTERSNPSASTIMTEGARINYLMSITARPRPTTVAAAPAAVPSVPQQSTPERATKRKRTVSNGTTWKKFDEREYILARNKNMAAPAPPAEPVKAHPKTLFPYIVSGTHRTWNTSVSGNTH